MLRKLFLESYKIILTSSFNKKHNMKNMIVYCDFIEQNIKLYFVPIYSYTIEGCSIFVLFIPAFFIFL